MGKSALYTSAPLYSAVVPADQLATAWLNVALAGNGTDKARTMYHRSVLVDFVDGGLVLASTDTYMLLASAVDATGGEDPPTFDLAPDHTVVARDVVGAPGRMEALMRHVYGLAVKAHKDDVPFHLEAHLDVVEEQHEAGLLIGFDGMEPVCLRVRIGDEELKLPTWEGVWPDWRAVWHRFEEVEAPGVTSWGAKTMARLAKVLGGADAQEEVRLAVRYGRQQGRPEGDEPERKLLAARVFAPSEPNLHGLVTCSSSVVDDAFAFDPFEAERGDVPEEVVAMANEAADTLRKHGVTDVRLEGGQVLRTGSGLRLGGARSEAPRDEFSERRAQAMAVSSDPDD